MLWDLFSLFPISLYLLSFPREIQGCTPCTCHVQELRFPNASMRNHRSLWSPHQSFFPVEINPHRILCTYETLQIWNHHVAMACIQPQEPRISPEFSSLSSYLYNQIEKKSQEQVLLNELTCSFLLPANTPKPQHSNSLPVPHWYIYTSRSALVGVSRIGRRHKVYYFYYSKKIKQGNFGHKQGLSPLFLLWQSKEAIKGI